MLEVAGLSAAHTTFFKIHKNVVTGSIENLKGCFKPNLGLYILGVRIKVLVYTTIIISFPFTKIGTHCLQQQDFFTTKQYTPPDPANEHSLLHTVHPSLAPSHLTPSDPSSDSLKPNTSKELHDNENLYISHYLLQRICETFSPLPPPINYRHHSRNLPIVLIPILLPVPHSIS